ncbi:TetR family transcriptional regulator [Streptomyces sp. SID4919]|uniref:TetR/AcrR family transcriptional regulator n=1 Tax=Streptomyces TaxID=1883 RepID=UPI0008238E37|nr:MULTISPECIES: TetR/AcrR family transcriptional regulator [Streptomyces]MYY07972.1 TetR family transcriptional regulator [Streptomyces sp. SID4919]SCK07577.1 transcriptional regulator, TetR family [Streptomyces sp. AmelKG-E11A]
MTTPPGRTAPTARRPRLRRGALTPERIVDVSLRLLDEHGTDGFTMPRLGKALGADQTAVYRHFAGKDEILLAVADRLLEEALTGFEAHPHWSDTLADVCRRVRGAYLAHPAAAALSGPRTTRRPAEMRAADTVIGALGDAGFGAAEAALLYRVVADFALLWSGGEAAFHSLDAETKAHEADGWARAYRAADPREYPHIHRVRDPLFEVDSADVFETALRLLLDSIEQRAPRPPQT